MAYRLKEAALSCIKNSVNSRNAVQALDVGAHDIRYQSFEESIVKCTLSLKAKDHELFSEFKEVKDNEVQIQEAGKEKSLHFTEISDHGNKVSFEVNAEDLIKQVVNSNAAELNFTPARKNIIVEYSSPNIAKMFHVGHFRSTIIGQFVDNIKRKFNHNVTSMNFLGNWGTHIGMLIAGIERMKWKEDDLRINTLEKLNNAYVYANKHAPLDPSIRTRASEIFQAMEDEDETHLRTWSFIMESTINDLTAVYKDLNVKFDVFNMESVYNKRKADPFLEDLKQRGLVTMDGSRYMAELNSGLVPLTKGDGSTLYILRDIMAFFDNRNRLKMDKCYYVVDGNQTEHFNSLKEICERIDPDSSGVIEHVRIGKVAGMSTRKGTGVLLKDILDEAQERMYEKQMSVRTTKGTPSPESARILGVTCLLLQYAYCRLCSLMKYTGVAPAEEVDPRAIMEPEMVMLALNISMFEEVLVNSERDLEPVYVIQYLFNLMKSINICLQKFKVKDAGDDYLSSQRLLLFNTARSVLGEGLRILGATLLQEM
ncbi:UNVERIFIED_CONTAM: hypothetical protein PYX00_003622 [Menopon gallinae]|uniref:Probable arginine--tRNA ligase, mitochondrial n=1 Tax=Menopon gallinae TaxID=328185 RepID=A0AAW2I1B9_9NEOP